MSYYKMKYDIYSRASPCPKGLTFVPRYRRIRDKVFYEKINGPSLRGGRSWLSGPRIPATLYRQREFEKVSGEFLHK